MGGLVCSPLYVALKFDLYFQIADFNVTKKVLLMVSVKKNMVIVNVKLVFTAIAVIKVSDTL